MNSWRDLLRPNEFGRIGALVGLMGAVAGGLIWLLVRLNEPPMGLLYADLAPDDAARIVERLDQAGTPYRQGGDGTVIYVPKDKVFSLRMEMASDGIPANGIVGYELFDSTDSFGTTSFVQNINRLRALEGELARTIVSMETVEKARVHLVLPERELFSREDATPTASIVVKAARGQLTQEQVEAIRYLVASAVRNLSPQNVAIVDERGQLLASGTGEGEGASVGSSLDERRSAFEARMAERVEDLVASIVGPSNVRVQVTAEMDFNRIVTESEIYDPEAQVVVSSETIEESDTTTDSEQSGAASLSTELPDGNAGAGSGNVQSSAANRVEERVNYQNSLTKQTQVQEGGAIRRISIAVAVNDVVSFGEDGTPSFAPRSAEEMQRISALVRSAIGYSETRGDLVEIANVRFTQSATAPQSGTEATEGGFSVTSLLPYAEKVILVVIAFILVFFVFRPLLTRLLQAPSGGGAPALPSPGGGGMLAGGGHGHAHGHGGHAALAGTMAGETAALPAPEGPIEKGIDIAQIQGQVKESSVRKVGELISRHPEESMSILRNWLYETG
ncbi:MAG: flagellar M-ring protein FliF [Alphaproteobacteria bacterium]|nr:flagellar M-ring protein FliF [Alphaproteobacteria bacterium]